MSNFVIALLFSAGSSTWIYTKFLRKTGNNTKTSIIATLICGLFIFTVVWIGLNILFG